jgi:hypothetical protein
VQFAGFVVFGSASGDELTRPLMKAQAQKSFGSFFQKKNCFLSSTQ